MGTLNALTIPAVLIAVTATFQGFDMEWQRLESIAKRDPRVLEYMRNRIFPWVFVVMAACCT